MSRASTRRAQSTSAPGPDQERLLNQAESMFGNISKSTEGIDESLLELLHQKEELDRKINILKAEHRRSALIQISNLIQLHGFTVGDLFPAGTRKPQAKRPPKFRNPTTGELWSGRGKAPRWYVVAEDKEALRISNQEDSALEDSGNSVH